MPVNQIIETKHEKLNVDAMMRTDYSNVFCFKSNIFIKKRKVMNEMLYHKLTVIGANN